MKERKISIKIMYILLLLLWLTGTMLLWTNDYKTPAIIISGGILLRSYIIETKKNEEV